MNHRDRIIVAYKKGYRVTDDGTLISSKGKILKGYIGTHGYLFFCIKDNKKTYSIPIHRFAAYCFYGDELFEHECVRHKNNIKTDNFRNNLILGSSKENYSDNPEDWKINFSLSGASKKRKLTEENVKEIRKMIAENYSYKQISEKFGVTKTTIQQIKEGKSYKWVL
jgi:hypothetical protein